MSSERLEIGRLGAAHGLAGEVSALLHFPGSNVLSAVERLWAVSESGETELTLLSAKPHRRGFLLRLAGVSDRTAAEKLRGARIEVERSALPPLGEGEYYLVDLIGATVFGPEGTPLGEVVRIQTHPSVDSVEVRLSDGRVAEQPLTAPWVARVDAVARRIELASLDGLIV